MPDDIDPAADAPEPTSTPTPTPEPIADDKLSLTQAELNKMMADNRRNLTKQNEEMASQLEALQSRISQTDEEREELAATIETLRTQTMSQEELAKRAAKQAETKHTQEISTLQEQLDQWKNRYEEETKARSLLDAANAAEAYDPEQIVSILGAKTKLAKVKSEETGDESLQVLVTFEHTDDDGNKKTLEISPTETVKLMKESKRFANLFLSPNTPGLGGTGNVPAEGEPNMDNMEEYMKWRSKQPSHAYGA